MKQRDEMRFDPEDPRLTAYALGELEGEERAVIGAVGRGDVTPCLESLEAMNQVEKAVAISVPYKFVSREFHPGGTIIKVKDAEFGGTEFPVIAGPCSVESEEQIMKSAEAVAAAGGKLLRGGAHR